MSEDIQYCAEQVRLGDPDRFLSAMTAPLVAREALFVLYAFNLEIVRAPWITKEAMIAEMRLQWWLDAIEEIYAGKAIRKHQVVEPLAKLIKERGLPRELFTGLITARRFDIYAEPHANAFAFDDYIRGSSGNLMALSVLALGQDNQEQAIKYGYGDGLARLFLAIPKLENAQKRPLVDGRPVAVGRLAQQGLDEMKAADFSDKSSNPALRSAWRAKSILRKAARNPNLVANGALESSEIEKKFRLLVKAMRNSY